MIVIADSTPLIALSRIGKLSLLRDIYGEVFIPPAVLQEVVDESELRPGALEVSQATWIQVRSPTVSQAAFLRALDLGETEAILLALDFPKSLLLIDESAGRREALNQGIKVVGTLGVLMHAKKIGLVPLLKPELDRLLSEGFHLSEEICQIALNASGEGD
jgi:uncharacterized protein